VGTELGETDTWLFGSRPKLEGKLIRIDIDPGQLGRNAQPEIAILSDAGLALSALERTFPKRASTAGASRVEILRRRLQDGLTEKQRQHNRLLAAVQQALPGVILVGDSTQPVYSGNFCYEPERPRSYFSAATGYGTLGYALPAALGAKLAEPERPVVALIGDGGLQFTIGELATAVELALPVPILLWNSHGYGEIKDYMVERGIPTIGVDIYTPDFLAIARGFGCAAVRATSFDQMQEELRQAHRAKGPTVIEIDAATAMRW